MKLRKVGAIAGIGVLVLAGCNQGGTSGGTKGTINIGIELPQQGSELAGYPAGDQRRSSSRVKDAGGTAGGWTDRDPELGRSSTTPRTASMTRRRAPRTCRRSSSNANVIAVIGPQNSSVAKAQIPISNEAGLLQCTPGEHERGPDQARVRRPRRPQDQPDEDQLRPRRHDGRPTRARRPPATSCRTSKSRTVYIIDSTETFGKGIADNFQKYFKDRRRHGRRVTTAPRRPHRLHVRPDRRQGQEPGRRSTSAASPPTAAPGS